MVSNPVGSTPECLCRIRSWGRLFTGLGSRLSGGSEALGRGRRLPDVCNWLLRRLSRLRRSAGDRVTVFVPGMATKSDDHRRIPSIRSKY